MAVVIVGCGPTEAITPTVAPTEPSPQVTEDETEEPASATPLRTRIPSETPEGNDDSDGQAAQQGQATASATDDCAPRTDWTQRYTIQSGDTLSSIASRAGVSTQALADGNCIEISAVILPGQQLNVPQMVNPLPPTLTPTGIPQDLTLGATDTPTGLPSTDTPTGIPGATDTPTGVVVLDDPPIPTDTPTALGSIVPSPTFNSLRNVTDTPTGAVGTPRSLSVVTETPTQAVFCCGEATATPTGARSAN